MGIDIVCDRRILYNYLYVCLYDTAPPAAFLCVDKKGTVVSFTHKDFDTMEQIHTSRSLFYSPPHHFNPRGKDLSLSCPDYSTILVLNRLIK